MSGFLSELEARLGVGALLRGLLRRRLAGGPRWSRALGAALLGLLLVQLLSGLGLAMHYAPTTTSAWASVHHLETAVPGGALVRALHAWGASALVLLLGAHLLASGVTAAYRRPREVAWGLGLLLVPLLLAFGLTGYLLPWDQRGYWATTVAVGIARATPLVGEPAALVLAGGSDLTSLTLTRFYAAHAVLLPGALLLLLLLHLRALSRAHRAELAAGGEPGAPWWPGQAARDLGLLAAALAAVFGLALAQGAGLEAPADPAVDFPARPEWWFLPLRELLKLVPEPWGSLLLPGAAGALWLLLPWLDPPQRPRPRLRALLVLGPALLYAALGLRAVLLDRADRSYLAARRAADQEADLARELARGGVPAEGAAALLERHPPRRGARLFERHCRECHPLQGSGGREAPDLTGYLTRGWLMDVIARPRDPRFFGHTELDGMEPLLPEQLASLPALAALLIAQDPTRRGEVDPALVERGVAAYRELECDACHPLERGVEGLAPNLAGYGSEEWLLEFLRAPGSPRFYGEDNDMPAYAGELSDEDLRALVVFLRGLRRE